MVVPTVAISLIVVSIVLPLLFRDNESVVGDSGKVEFAFNKNFKTVMLFCTVIFVVIALVFFVTTLYNDKKDALVAVLVFALLALLSSFLYLLARNKKIVYVGGILYAYGILGKQRSFKIRDIKEAIESPADGMKLVFKDGKVVKVDIEMVNYSKIKEILEKNGIAYRDKNGSNAPKGW